ncbi:MAG: hypothetical protein DI626_05785 [Micavibrio aeruginosavorus]|uniref:Uncharacterized protein n=1 Tax=Micavibrio aeruginosavorus TaxID=349221 RepID=A0A2W5A022_9BACT|nr:MAG: hypothetical protein DI626_05785 [Micavibrio aeruginosavorus]
MPLFWVLTVAASIPLAAVVGYRAAKDRPFDGKIVIRPQSVYEAEARKVNVMAAAAGATVAYLVYKRK